MVVLEDGSLPVGYVSEVKVKGTKMASTLNR